MQQAVRFGDWQDALFPAECVDPLREVGQQGIAAEIFTQQRRRVQKPDIVGVETAQLFEPRAQLRDQCPDVVDTRRFFTVPLFIRPERVRYALSVGGYDAFARFDEITDTAASAVGEIVDRETACGN